MADPIKPTAADHDAAYALVPFLCAPTFASEVAKAFARHAQQAREQALDKGAMMIEVAAFQTDPNNPPHEIWTHGFETAREVFAAALRALKEQPPC